MLKNLKYKLVLLLLFSSLFSFSQVIPTAKDSSKGYRNIQNYSKKNKFTRFMHGLIFEPIRSKIKPIKIKKIQKRFYGFQGKIIRKINIVTLDPFGFSEIDSTVYPTKSLPKIGNSLHTKSKRLTIRNLLLFRRNKPLDSLLVKESERLIRTQRFIRGIIITPKLVSEKSDSVDVYIRVLDSWSLIPNVSASKSNFSLDLNERNFLGTGHQFENKYQKRFTDGETAYSTRYTIPNILNSYIKTILSYQIDLDNNFGRSFNVERPFYSPFANWAAGIYFDQQYKTVFLPDENSVFIKQNYKYNSHDLWAGNAIQIFKGNSEDERTTNLITTGRFLKLNFLESPALTYDKENYFSSENLYLFSLGISSRQYVQDKYLFNYRIIEDVPIGTVLAFTGGFQEKNNQKRLYLGTRISFGRYYKWGYLSSNFEYGTYFNKAQTEQSAFSAQVNYFTNLTEINLWKFRQFVKAQVILGDKRFSSIADQINLNEDNGIPGFNTTKLFGTKKMVFSFQTQSYSPFDVGGFRFNPYINYTLGVLGNAATGFKKSKAYSQFGIGLIIRNDYLVFSTFQLSLAFYPSIPGNDGAVFKTNAINTEDFGFQNFEINKPQTVDYR